MEAEMRAVAKSAARHVGNEHGNHPCVANHMAVLGAPSVGVRLSRAKTVAKVCCDL